MCVAAVQATPVILDADATVDKADCDLRARLHAKRWFDAVRHYSRGDVLPSA